MEIFLTMLAHPTPNHRTTPRRASLSSLVRMMNNRLGCNEITPPLALLSPTGPISCDNVEQNFIYRSNKHFSSSWTDMNMSQLWVMKRRKLNFSHLVFPLLLLASSSSIRGETIGSNPTNIRLGKSDYTKDRYSTVVRESH